MCIRDRSYPPCSYQYIFDSYWIQRTSDCSWNTCNSTHDGSRGAWVWLRHYPATVGTCHWRQDSSGIWPFSILGRTKEVHDCLVWCSDCWRSYHIKKQQDWLSPAAVSPKHFKEIHQVEFNHSWICCTWAKRLVALNTNRACVQSLLLYYSTKWIIVQHFDAPENKILRC